MKMMKSLLNRDNAKEFLLYVVVGGIATLTEWVFFYLIAVLLSWHYIVSTTIAYIISTFVNWIAGRILVFKSSDKSISSEVFAIYVVGVLGLLMNIGIMFVMIDKLNINSMISKVFATGVVFIWNFIVRKLFIYKVSSND